MNRRARRLSCEPYLLNPPKTVTRSENVGESALIASDGWIFESDSCHFDLYTGFAVEWKAMKAPFAVAEFETTSACQRSGELLEVAVILAEPSGAITAEFSSLISIGALMSGYIAGHSETDQPDVNPRAQPADEGIESFLNFIGSRPVFIRGAPFDLAFLEKASEQAQVRFSNPVYDTQVMAVLAWSPLECDNIDVLAQHVGVHKSGDRAIDAAKVTLAVLLAIRDEANNGSSVRGVLKRIGNV